MKYIYNQVRPLGLKNGSAEWGGEFQGIQEWNWAPNTFRAGQKNYLCHGTGVTVQMDALVYN